MKVALVTGAAAGIGAEIARRLSRDSIAIGVLDLRLADAAKVADEINAGGGKAIALEADITRRTQVRAAIAKLRAALGPVTILVNNAGMTAFTPFEQITEELWDKVFEVNVKGTFIVTQEALADMKAAGWGRIVNISSSSAQSGAVNMAHYSASKGAVIVFTKTLARELGPLGITVNNIPPRFVMGTIMSEANVSPEHRKTMAEAGPIMREGRPADIAGAAAWLVSDEAGYVTGQTIGVNGGRYI